MCLRALEAPEKVFNALMISEPDFFVTLRPHLSTIQTNTQYMKGEIDMKKITFNKDATIFKRVVEYFDDYLTEFVITCAFLFIIIR